MTHNLLSLLINAFHEGHDVPFLRAKLAIQIPLLQEKLPMEAALSPRLRRLIQDPQAMKWMDLEDLIDVISSAAPTNNEQLQDELLALRLTVARLGGIHSSMKIGREIVDQLRSRSSRRTKFPS